jgi:hypothetical protein
VDWVEPRIRGYLQAASAVTEFCLLARPAKANPRSRPIRAAARQITRYYAWMISAARALRRRHIRHPPSPPCCVSWTPCFPPGVPSAPACRDACAAAAFSSWRRASRPAPHAAPRVRPAPRRREPAGSGVVQQQQIVSATEWPCTQCLRHGDPMRTPCRRATARAPRPRRRRPPRASAAPCARWAAAAAAAAASSWWTTTALAWTAVKTATYRVAVGVQTAGIRW